ncbi:MAG TPA: hypothetical protein VHE55_14030 [Fimbriimonadaceae bacterium]|nr:hypothetical protein [Fimbriimonadaceae bacterium]
MRSFLTFVAALGLAAFSLADGGWLLKPPYEAKAKISYKVTVDANVGGQDHEATMKQLFTVDSKSDKEVKGKGSFSDVTLDGNDLSGQDLPSWDVTLSATDGSVTAAGDSVDYVRMLTPFTFIYPSKEIKVGDKWTTKFKPAKDAKEITIDYEVVEQSKIGDDDVLKIKSKLSEDGPMKADDTYWIGKDGKVLKFDLDIKGWPAPFTGGAQDIDAKIKGEYVKS